MSTLMGLRRISKAGVAHPFGDERAVLQAFPSGINEKDADPFLMCDYFSGEDQTGPPADQDDFSVDWHPHRGFDICSYLKAGAFRHGDSLGNRESFGSPGMQWISTGSGIFHAEGGENQKGDKIEGFQIWINVPSERKMEDPRYGTVPPSDFPTTNVAPNVNARVLGGSGFGVKQGPFETTQPVQMIDLEFDQPSEGDGSAKVSFDVETGLDTAMLYVYEGSLDLSVPDGGGSQPLEAGSIALFDASSDAARGIEVALSSPKAGAMLFAGKKLNQPIAWHGPIVMTTQDEIRQTLRELRRGQFPPKRVDWDYTRIASKLVN